MTPPPPSQPFDCVARAWQRHRADVHRWLAARAPEAADDLSQEVFLRALRQGDAFCTLDHDRAWLFRVARNVLIDHGRTMHEAAPLPPEVPNPPDAREPVDALDACLPRALAVLPDDDRDVIEACDLRRQLQQDYADAHGLGLPAVKGRLRRARARLREALVELCGVRFDESGRVCCHRAA